MTVLTSGQEARHGSQQSPHLLLQPLSGAPKPNLRVRARRQQDDLHHMRQRRARAKRLPGSSSQTLPPLLSTCKQIRSEALALFWANKTICYIAALDYTNLAKPVFIREPLSLIFKNMGAHQASLVKKVQIQVCHSSLLGTEQQMVDQAKTELKLEQFGILPHVIEVKFF